MLVRTTHSTNVRKILIKILIPQVPRRFKTYDPHEKDLYHSIERQL